MRTTMANPRIRVFKIRGLPKDEDFHVLPFGRQIEYQRRIDEFKASAQTTWLSQKRQSYKSAIRDAVKLLTVAEYFCHFAANEHCSDDSFEFWYTTKPVSQAVPA